MSPFKTQNSEIMSVIKNASLPGPVVATLSFSADTAANTDGASTNMSNTCPYFRENYEYCDLEGDLAFIIEMLTNLIRKYPDELDNIYIAEELSYWMEESILGSMLMNIP